ncbi:dynamin family protein [uncultured Rothia sp.]|uniref:dynamin family protein n=1 Tax=uncultured Rothia sp. TaxID=316088 RepID=UPI003217F34C
MMASRTHRTESSLTSLSSRYEELDAALEEGQGRVDPDVLEQAKKVLDRTSQRRELSAEHTVIGFFGATGSGKSSLFNAVIGQKVAQSAARRPTTSTAQAAVWGRAGSEELLNWLNVENRVFFEDDGAQAAHALNQSQVPRTDGLWSRMKNMVGKADLETHSGGLILLDLPDFDSIEKSNRAIVEKMAGYVDVLVWVFDPQKYADAVIHHDFIAPLAEHGSVTLAVMNQSDRIREQEQAEVLDSLQRLLAEDGLSKNLLAAPLAVSALTGQGIDRLRAVLGHVAVEKSAALARIEADLDTVYASLAEHDGSGIPDGVSGSSLLQLDQGLFEASNAPAAIKAAEASYQLHATSNTGWIATRWLLKFRKDPLKRLNLHRSDEGATLTRSSLPPLNSAQKSQISSSIRRFAQDCSEGVGEPWNRSIRDAARSAEHELPSALERAVARLDFKAQKKQWWWVLLNVIQWIGIIAALVGLLWLSGLALASYFQLQLPAPPTPEGSIFPLPTLLAITGILLGIVTAFLGRVFTLLGKRMYARKLESRLRDNIEEVSEEYVANQVRQEVNRHLAYCGHLEKARSSS